MTATRAGGRHGKPWRAAGAAVVVLLAMGGAAMIGVSQRTVPPPRPPQPAAQATPQATPQGNPQATEPVTDGDLGGPSPADGPAVAPLARSAPTTISIPRIGVDAEIMALGTNPDGTVQVPPLDQAQRAGWYEPGSSPGEAGNAVIVGHVDSVHLGPAVFFELGSMQRGDLITVARTDGTKATFIVDEVTSYPKTAFPTERVYGPSERPGLRVVTCGGTFDKASASYLSNVVVYATMTA
ncbi:class F sortase [Micromonospora psammae]|uniref:class F sortase n=1 Tax=Micromonospora sp. CPCC 205556 TaxID=3122398 RepID=UPI002FF1FC79